MIGKIASVVCLALSVLGHEPAISEQKVIMRNKEHSGHHGELSHIGPHKPEHHEEYAWSYPSYEFSYHVHDPHTHDNKGQKEVRDGDVVKGEYWLIEPDGRKRTVKYHADKHSGFNAHVEYSAPHHHVHFKTHKHVEHKPVVEHHHEEHIPDIELQPIKEHHEEHELLTHKPVVEHHHIEHIPHVPVIHHHHEHKPVIEHHEPHHDHRPWLIPRRHSHHGHHGQYGHHGHHGPILRRFQEISHRDY